MELLSLVFKEKYRTCVLIIFLGLLTGGIHVGLLVMINKIIGDLLKREGMPIQALIYALSLLLLYLVLNKVLTNSMIKISQKVIHDLRMLLTRSVLKLPYEEREIKGEVFKSAITKDTISLSHAALSSINLITSIVTVLGCLVYLGYVSIQILSVILIVLLIGISIFLLNSYNCKQNLQQARESEDKLFYYVGQVMDGFRELKINSLKSENLIEGPLLASSFDSYNFAVKGLTGYFNNGLIGQFIFYLAIILLLFSGNSFFHLQPFVLVNCIIIILYLIGPLEATIALLPDIGIGNIAAARLNKILSSIEDNEVQPSQIINTTFNQLTLQSVCYSYDTINSSIEPGFILGPIEFVLNKGTTTFIYGGNGSGKTTFFHMILGLIKIQQGELLLNNRSVTANESISTLFAPVFSDFHLFDKLYGIGEVEHEKVTYYLRLFELDGKVTFEEDHFSTIDLSTGQRKRLALIAALLEKRPLLFLDEWAADQDPFFRTKFYKVILPALKEEGQTILAITHDDKYYHTADALYRMDFGQLIKEK